MAIKQYKPTTPGRRGMTTQDFDAITTKKPLQSLLVPKRRGNGRNNQGRITTRHKGGGAKKFYRYGQFQAGCWREQRRSSISNTTLTAAPASPVSKNRTAHITTYWPPKA